MGDRWKMDLGDHVEIGGYAYRVAEEMPPVTEKGGKGCLYLVPEPIMCEACGKNDASDYQTGSGKNVCPTCVNLVLAYRVAHAVLTHVDQFDNNIARAIAIMDDDDDGMRGLGIPYVDSESAGWDLLRGEDNMGAWEYLIPIFVMIHGATRDPGDIPTGNDNAGFSRRV